MLSYTDYLDRVYGGFLGMNAGIRLGVPLEPNPWTYETIQKAFGDIKDYVSHFTRFAADDDANGPVYFVRALTDKLREQSGEMADLTLTPKEVGEAWLEYTREGKGMFWWGGVGVSTEHTAYENLKQGIPAPKSGSMAQNGPTMAEQIGGQIFVDSWGLICPGNPTQAAAYARTASSVSHDGEGLHGAAFMAAAISSAFTADSVEAILEAGLSQIPADSLYTQVVRSVMAFHKTHPEDWHLCMEYLLAHWGYDRFVGECHIIPNAGVCALALCYGGGDFARTIEIAVMCGWDTDCNAGNVGTIMGAYGGSASIPDRYRKPMEDSLVASGISGYLNILDMPSFSRELAHVGCLITGIEEPASALAFWEHPGELHYDFSMAGATHGFLLSENTCTFLHQTRYDNTPCLEIDMERVFNGQGPCFLYHPAFFTREDFNDERYEPVFSPIVYSGQILSCLVRCESLAGDPITVTPCLTTVGKNSYHGDPLTVSEDHWTRITWQIPDTDGDLIHRLGFFLEVPAGGCCRLFLADFSVTGGGHYRIRPSLQRRDFGGLTPFSLNTCTMTGDSDSETFHLTSQTGGAAFTGNYYGKDVTICGRLCLAEGSLGGFLLQAKGARTFAFAGLDSNGYGVIGECVGGVPKILARSKQTYAPGRFYNLKVSEAKGEIHCTITGENLSEENISAPIAAKTWGMTGLVTGPKGDLTVGELEISFLL